MAEYTIDKIEYNSNVYKLQDNVSGYITASHTSTYELPTASSNVLGGVKLGYTTSGNNRAVKADSNGNLYVTQKDDNTNTTYTLSGALSSHKFTSTLTAGGSGSGTSTSDFTLAAGTGITITDDTSNRKMTIACSVTNTDENVKSTAGGAGTDAFYLTGSSSSSTATGTLVKHAEIYAGHNPSGAYISIGGSSSNYRGWIKLYSSGASYYATLQPADNFTDNRIITLPDKTGTVALTSDIPTKTSDLTNDSGFLTAIPTSGVTAGTYDGGADSKNGFYIPSFTVDNTGRITSATDLGALIPFVTPVYGSVGILDSYRYGRLFKCTGSGSYDGYISTSETSKTVTISAGNSYTTSIWGVVAYGNTTKTPVIVDWTTSGQASATSIDVTVSIAETYNETIYFKILTTNTGVM